MRAGGSKEIGRPGRRRSLRTPARKANEFGFRTQTPEPQKEKRRPGRRRRLRTPACKANEFGFRTQPRAGKKKKPARGPSDSPVLGALLSAYREVTGDDSRPISIGGGTYAKAMPNMVAFGPNFPGHENREHMEDEYILVGDFLKLEEIYERALAYLLDSSDAASSSSRIDSAFA